MYGPLLMMIISIIKFRMLSGLDAAITAVCRSDGPISVVLAPADAYSPIFKKPRHQIIPWVMLLFKNGSHNPSQVPAEEEEGFLTTSSRTRAYTGGGNTKE